MGAIAPGTVEAVFIFGLFALVVGALIVGFSPPGQRLLAATCVGGTLAALVAWLLLFRLLFGVAA